MKVHVVVLLMLGGATGTLLRAVLAKWLDERPWARGLPLGTFVINVTGSFVLGFAAVVIKERLPSRYSDWFFLIGTGFCGGYTTFSTFEWESFQLIRDGSWGWALANMCGSVLIGFAGVLLGVALACLLFPGPTE
jgi:CrcB protein